MDTIAAISTANAVSAIGILRLSGPEAFPIADRVFRPAAGGPLSAHPRRTMVLGALLDRQGRPIDHCLAVTFAAGASYTGEDSVEFHCHGSPPGPGRPWGGNSPSGLSSAAAWISARRRR